MEQIITKDEIELAELLLDPILKMHVFWSDFKNNKIWQVRGYQEDFLLDRSDRISVRAARGVGKSEELSADILDTIIKNPGKEGVLTTPRSAHIERTWEKLRSRIYADVFLRDMISRSVRMPHYLLEFTNGFVLYGRISSASAGESLLSLHVDFVWVDEAQLYMQKATNQLQGILNTNATIKTFGVPNGIRKGYLYKSSQDQDFEPYKITKFEDPSFTEEQHKRLIKIYGGKHTQAYKNQVLAENADATNVTFPEKFWKKCLYCDETFEPTLLDGKDFDDINYSKLPFDLPEPHRLDCSIHLSSDLGFEPDPSIIKLWNIINGVKVMFGRFRLNKVEYYKQSKFIDFLMRHYGATRVSLDEGSAGRTVAQELQNEYSKGDYMVVPIKFGGTVEIGRDENDKPIKKRIKFYSTVLMERAFEEKTISLPEEDLELIDEIHTSTQRCTNAGNYIYDGVDHCLDAIRCEIIADYLDGDSGQGSHLGVIMVDL